MIQRGAAIFTACLTYETKTAAAGSISCVLFTSAHESGVRTREHDMCVHGAFHGPLKNIHI